MKELESFLDDISSKFGYSETLTNDLRRIIPIMLRGKDEEKKQMLLETLAQVKIFVLPEDATLDELQACKTEVFGGTNQGIIFEEMDMGEYSKNDFPAGAYTSEPIFDDEMNIIGRNRMIHVKELSEYSKLKQVYGSNIDLSHLIHELGHAWAAQIDEYVQNEDGTFVQNVGTTSIISSVDKARRTVAVEKIDGLFIEESLNTIQEEETILELTGVSSVAELVSKGYVRSAYQGMQTDLMRSYVDKFGHEVFEEYRYSKQRAPLVQVEQALSDTEAWEILRTESYGDKKRGKIAEVEKLEVSQDAKNKIKAFFDEYEDVYFPKNSSFTPIQKLDNVLEQVYNFSEIKYNFNIMGNDNNLEIYKSVITAIVAEANALRIQARDIEQSTEKDFMTSLQAKVKPPEEAIEYVGKNNEKQVEKDIVDIEEK